MLKSQMTMRGFGMIEMMIAVVLIGLLMSFAIPNFTVWVQNNRIRNASESMLNGLQVARMEAVRHNAPVQFVMGVGSAWTVGCVTPTAGCPAMIQSRPASEGSSNTVTVVASDANTIVFDAFGRMSSPVPAAGARTQFTIDNTALNPADSRDMRVTVDVGGNTRMCDPNVAAADDPRSC